MDSRKFMVDHKIKDISLKLSNSVNYTYNATLTKSKAQIMYRLTKFGIKNLQIF